MRKPKSVVIVIGLILGLFSSFCVSAHEKNSKLIARGKYIVEISGCNDCHTAGYAPSGGHIPVKQWLLGDKLGFRGPWGTTYPINLREYVNTLSEAEWVKKARTLKARPPMPSWALNAMSKHDLIALYAFIKSLGAVKNDIPAYVAPAEAPKTAYVQWPMPPK